MWKGDMEAWQQHHQMQQQRMQWQQQHLMHQVHLMHQGRYPAMTDSQPPPHLMSRHALLKTMEGMERRREAEWMMYAVMMMHEQMMMQHVVTDRHSH